MEPMASIVGLLVGGVFGTPLRAYVVVVLA
jgi:hypothetical protein